MSSCCALSTSLPVFAIQANALLAHTGQVIECPAITGYKSPACLVIDDTFIVNKHYITLDNSFKLLYTVIKIRREDIENENYN